MERDARQSGGVPKPPEKYEPPAVEWEEPFDPLAASDPMNPECSIDPQACQ